MARTGDEVHAEALDAVVGVVERMDFQLATVARAGIHLADREAAAEQFADLRFQLHADLGCNAGSSIFGSRFSDDADFLDFLSIK